MELILKQDIEGLGFKDDVVTVKNGYGRNFLIPGGQAVLATTSAKKVLAENLKQRAFKEQKLVDDANALSIDKKFITVSGGNVKRLGKYNAQIRLHRDVSVELPFEIIAEKA